MKLERIIVTAVIFLLAGLTKANCIEPPKSAYFDSNGFKIHYYEQGSGETVLLLHGFVGGAIRWIETEVMQGLAENYHVVAMDARAHGKSDKPRDKEAYGLETALDVIRLMDHLQVDKAHLVGSSFGARIGTTILSRYPERFITATLIGGRPQWDWTKEKQAVVEKQAEGFINNPRPVVSERGLDPTALAYLRLSFSELIVESASKFKALEIPFLLVYGSDEWIHLNGLDKELQEMLINAKIYIIDGAKHGETYPRPEFLTTLKEFLKENQ